jgi:hypothetical protein
MATAVDRRDALDVRNVRLLAGNLALINAVRVAIGDAPGYNSLTNATNVYPVVDD